MRFESIENYSGAVKETTKKVETVIASVLVAFLATFPLLTKFLQGVCHIQIFDSDVAVTQFMFLLSCLAGFVTWHEKRHLSLASLSDKLPPKARVFTENVKVLLMTAVLTALFIDCVCQAANPEIQAGRFWGIPLKLFFLALPLCYLLILAYNFFSYLKHCATDELGSDAAILSINSLILCIAGFLLGLAISGSTILGVLYYARGVESNAFLAKLAEGWFWLAGKAMVPFLLILLVSAFMGVPLFLVLGGFSYVLFSANGGYVDVIPLETLRILTERNTLAIPLFTIAGYILSQSKAGKRYVALFRSLFGSFRGGTVIASVIVVTLFSTFTGVSGVTILALGGLLSIALAGSGYDKGRGESLVTASGAIGLLFPPSAAIIMYATVNYFSVDVFDLFKGALIPGLLMMASMIILGVIFDTRKTRDKFSAKALASSLFNALPELLMPLLMCVFYFRGVFDLFETAAFAVVYSYLLTTLPRLELLIGEREKEIAKEGALDSSAEGALGEGGAKSTLGESGAKGALGESTAKSDLGDSSSKSTWGNNGAVGTSGKSDAGQPLSESVAKSGFGASSVAQALGKKLAIKCTGGDFSFKQSLKTIFGSVPVFGGVIFILGAAAGISYFVLDASVPEILTKFIKSFVSSKIVFLLLMNIVLLFVGCIMDMFSAILIVSPLLLPLAESFGVSAVHAAVIFLMNLSIGFLTPPVGMDLFISSYTFNKPMGRVVKGILPFLAVQFVVLLLVTYVPWFTSAIR